MSKILKKATANNFSINDTGETVPGLGQLVIDPAKYALYARSNDAISAIADGTLTYNDGENDLTLSEATRHLQGSFPKDLTIDKSPPFANKTIMVNGVQKSLYKRVHGLGVTIQPGTTGFLDFAVPWPVAKFTGAEVFGVDLKDIVNFFVLDTVNNDYSGQPGSYFVLNQFGFDVEMPPGGTYKNTSNYDADIYAGMIISCAYKNNGAAEKYISMNSWLHEVK